MTNDRPKSIRSHRRPERALKRRGRIFARCLVSGFMLASVLAGVDVAKAPTALAAETKIGVSLPMGDRGAVLANQFLEGARLAVEKLASNDSVELVVVNDDCEETSAELAVSDLKKAGVSLATGFLCNEAAFAAVRGFQKSGVPVLVAGAQSDRLMKDAQKEKWNVWRLAPADRDAAVAAAEDLAVRWRGRPWAVVDDGTAYGRTFADELRNLMEEAGQPAQLADNFRPAQSNQVGLVRRLMRSGVSAAFIASGAEDFAIIANDMAEAGSEIEMAGGPTLAMLPLLDATDGNPDAGKPALDGVLAVMEPDPAARETAAGLSHVLAEQEIEPEPYVYLGYAALEIALAAIRADPAETSAVLADTVFHTVLGNVDFDETGRNRLNPFRIFVWRDGGFRPAFRPTGESRQ